MKCTATAIVATGCGSSVNPNELYVNGTASTDTWFAGLFGIKHFNVSAHANACSPCSSTPVDIVVAIDRTGSMCDTKDGTFCRDLDNAKDGVQTMLKLLNPPYAQVGMVAFPPVKTTSTSVCDAPYNSLGNGWDGYDAPNRGYVTDAMNGNYKLNGALNPASGLVLHTTDGPASACIQAGGSTSYTEALRQAKAELDRNGHPNVPDYIIFLTDGEANLGSVYGVNSSVYPPGGPEDQQPCHTAIGLANDYKQNYGVTIYSIGYALGTKNCTAGKWPYVDEVPAGKKNKPPAVPGHYCDPATESPCEHGQGSVAEVGPLGDTITSRQTLTAIASTGDFYEKASAGDLDTIFSAIATDIGQGSSRLVDDSF